MNGAPGDSLSSSMRESVSSSLHGRTLLIVDGDPSTTRQWDEVASSQGIAVRRVASLREAGQLLLHCGPSAFDFSIIECELPDGSGTELVPTLRAVQVKPVFAIVSARRDDALVLSCWDDDINVLPKPQSQQALLDLLRRLEHRRQTSRRHDKLATRKPHVLVVDDSIESTQLVIDSLGDDYRVDIARDGYEGLRTAHESLPDVILCDMRSLDSSHFLHILRGRRQTAGIPIIVMTANADHVVRARLLSEGADDFLVKPLVTPELLLRVRNLAGFSRARAMLGDHSTVPLQQLERLVEQVLVEKRRAVLLSDISMVLGATLEYGEAIGQVLRLIVTDAADAALLELLGRDGRPGTFTLAHVDAAAERELRELYQRQRQEPEGTHTLMPALATGRTEWIQGADSELLRTCDVRTGLCVPLYARDRLLGAFTVLSCSDERLIVPTDRRVAEALGNRIALAIEHAELYRASQEAVAARDEFLSIASHELKTPLNPLQLQVQTLIRKVPEFTIASERDKVAKKLDSIRNQAGKLTRLINDLLDVSRISGDKVEYELAPTDLSEVARDVIALCEQRDEFARQGCKPSVWLSPGLVGNWDRLRVEQIVTNLLTNALKYGAGAPIALTTKRNGAMAELRVKDGGLGVKLEDRERIFELYERAVSSRHYGGLGLGLFIVRKLAEAQGGRVICESSMVAEAGAADSGSTFLLSLPLL